MNNIQLALQLDQLVQAGPIIFMKLKPEVVDFTRREPLTLVFWSKSQEIEIALDSENIMEVFSLVKAAIFEDRRLSIIGWNLKNLFTYVLSFTGEVIEYEGKLLDLKLAECFIGVRERAPTTFSGMVARLKKLFADSSWSKYKAVHNNVYQSLMTRVIPNIETEGVFDTERKLFLFPYYEIEGQAGGRLSTQLAYGACFNPHSLSDEEKAKLKPRFSDCSFLSFDYHFHEVCVLAWLSQDEKLLELVSGEGDFYRKLYKELSGKECSDERRSFCKDCLFLPVVYGQSAKTLAERANIELDLAGKLIARLKDIFPKLFAWVENYPSEDNCYVDYIGRKRCFAEGEEYKYRNFIIQSPGAIFCLEKLVVLHDKLKGYGRLVAHIHDGFVVRAEDKQVETARSICMSVLQGESHLFPGLKLSTNCKISKTLA